MKRDTNAIFCLGLGLVAGIFFGLIIAESTFSDQRKSIDAYTNSVDRVLNSATAKTEEATALQAKYYRLYAELLVSCRRFETAVSEWNKKHVQDGVDAPQLIVPNEPDDDNTGL